MPNEETLTKNAEKEVDINEDQQNLKHTSNIDAERSPENLDENQTPTPRMLLRFKKKNYPQIHVVKCTN